MKNMNSYERKVYALREPFSREVFLHYREVDHAGRHIYQAEILMKEIAEGGAGGPILQLSETLAQSLMDQLWDCGLRPSEGSGSAGSLAATQRHLEDMRALVFKNKPQH